MTTPRRARPEDFLELLERSQRGRLKLYLGFAAGVGKTYRMLEEAHQLRKRGVDVVGALVETHGRAETAALIDGLELVPERRVEYRGVVVKELDLDGGAGAQAGHRHRRRDPAHQRPRLAQPEALPGRAGPAGRRHPRHRRHERAAPRVAQRPDRAGHRGAGARDGARHLPGAGRPGGQPRPRGRGPARPAPGREDLRAREGGLGGGALLQGDQPDHAARAGAARGGREPGADRQRRSPVAGEPATRGGAHPRPAHGLPLLEPAARRGPAAPGLADGRPAQHRLVRGLRRDAGRGAGPDRLGGAAPPARQPRAGARAGRRGGAAPRRRPGGRAPRLRPLAPGQRRAGGTEPAGLVAAGRCAASVAQRLVDEGTDLDLHLVGLDEEGDRP